MSRMETAVWVGVWFVGLSYALEVDRWPQDEWSLSMFVCVWWCKFTVGGHRLWETGGRSRCWGGSMLVQSVWVWVCVSLREADRQCKNLEYFTRGQLLCFKKRTCGEKPSCAGTQRGVHLACMKQQTWWLNTIFSAVGCKWGEPRGHHL